jgi:hypothetical protein
MKKLESLKKFGISEFGQIKVFGGRTDPTYKDLEPKATTRGTCVDTQYDTADDNGRTVYSCVEVTCPK